jgi:hypothetical protein
VALQRRISIPSRNQGVCPIWKVDINDLGERADAFGTTPASPDWNEDADLNCDGKVDILDPGLLADNYGKKGGL